MNSWILPRSHSPNPSYVGLAERDLSVVRLLMAVYLLLSSRLGFSLRRENTPLSTEFPHLLSLPLRSRRVRLQRRESIIKGLVYNLHR